MEALTFAFLRKYVMHLANEYRTLYEANIVSFKIVNDGINLYVDGLKTLRYTFK